MKIRSSLILGMFLLGAAAFAQEEAAFDLHCTGSGTATDTDTTTVHTNSKTDGKSNSVVQSQTKRDFEGAVDVKIGVGEAKIRLPKDILPTLTSVKADGWSNIKDLEITEREITGKLSFNFANKPKLRIDRTTGEIYITGSGGSFTGTCKKYDPDAVKAF